MTIPTITLKKLSAAEYTEFPHTEHTDLIGYDGAQTYIVPQDIDNQTVEIIDTDTGECYHYDCLAYISGVYVGVHNGKGVSHKISVQFELPEDDQPESEEEHQFTGGVWATDCAEHDQPHQNIRIVSSINGHYTIATVHIDDACFELNREQADNARLMVMAKPMLYAMEAQAEALEDTGYDVSQEYLDVIAAARGRS